MRIGLLTTSFPRFDGDVAGHFVLGFARALAARGHEVRVLSPEPHERIAAPSWPGVRVHWVPYLRPRALEHTFYGAGVPDNLRRDPRAWLGAAPFSAALALAARRELGDCDALVSHWALPCALAAAAARGSRPHLAVLHSADLHLLSRLPARARLTAAIAAEADALWFVSGAQRDRFLSWLPGAYRAGGAALPHVHVEPMGIDHADPPEGERARLRRELGLSRFTLLTIARLVPVKGLVEAVRSLQHRGDLEWLIAGDGPEAGRIARAAARGPLRVRLLGSVTGAAKHSLLRAADVFALPSRVLPSGRSEGVPTALLEAMAQGLPPVASAVGGIPAAVHPRATGLLFDPDDSRGLERTIDQLARDPHLHAAIAGRARVQGRAHHWPAVAPRIEALLERGAAACPSAQHMHYPGARAVAPSR